MHSLTLRAVVAEIDARSGSRVERVSALGPREVRIRLEDGSGLVVLVHPEHDTMFLAPGVEDGNHPLAFADALARVLTRARILGASQAGLDRVVFVRFAVRDRLGDPLRRQLVVELTGRGGNLFLVDGDEPGVGTVLEQLRTEPSGGHSEPRRRGRPYRRPPTGRPDLLEADESSLAASLEAAREAGRPPADALLAAWQGLDPAAAQEIARSVTPTGSAQDWVAAARRFVEEVRPGHGDRAPGPRFRPVSRSAGPRLEALVFQPEGAGTVEPGATASEVAARAYRGFRSRRGRGGGVRTHLGRALKQARKRTERGLDAVRRDMESAREADGLRRIGEALLSAPPAERGRTRAEIPDPRSGEILEVKLNPKLDAAGNAELYFKRARKANRSAGRIEVRETELVERLAALDELTADLDSAPDAGPDAQWIERARAAGVSIPRSDEEERDAPPEERLPSALRPRRYELGHGWVALVGRNNKGNDVLTHEIARPGDTWMHADQAAGSHLVLRHDQKGKEPPGPVVLAAAAIAAWYSKARNAAKVPVLVTQKRYVRRPRKGAPGLALVSQHKTFMVRPQDPDARETG